MKATLTSLLAAALIVTAPAKILAQQEIDNGNISDAARLLSLYVQYASVTGNEQEAGRYLSTVCSERGLHVEVFSDEINSYNFAASLYPLSDGRPNIILLNHIDVVPPGNESAWNYAPFSGAIAEGAVWGRGTIDMKGMAVMQLTALTRMLENARNEDLPFNVTMLCVSGEEGDGSRGAERVVAEHLDRLNPAVVFGEGGAGLDGLVQSNPDQMVFAVSTTDKQALWLKVSVKIPTSGHGSVPPSEYANKLMVKGLSRLMKKKSKIEITEANKPMFTALGNMEKGPMGVVLRNISWMVPIVTPTIRKDPKILATVSNTITLTNLSNETTATNQIAQEVTASLDCRLMPETDRAKFMGVLNKCFRGIPHTVLIEHETINAKPSPVTNPFFHEFKSSLMDVYPGAKVLPILFPAYTDNNWFRKHDIPVYGINPVFLPLELLESVHNVNEHLPIESLDLGADVYTLFLQKVMQQQQSITRATKNRKAINVQNN